MPTQPLRRARRRTVPVRATGATRGTRRDARRFAPLRMGGWGTFAAVDPSIGAVDVSDNTDGAVSLLPDGKG